MSKELIESYYEEYQSGIYLLNRLFTCLKKLMFLDI